MAGTSGGTPGLTTTSEARPMRSRSCVPTSTATPSPSRIAAVASSSGDRSASDAYTAFPVRARSVATERPLRASPITAISRTSHSARSAGAETRGAVISAQLERAQRHDRREDADDPEAHHDLRLGPSLHFEMVMQGRPQEESVLLGVLQAIALPTILEDEALAEHRKRLRHEHEADEEKQEFGLQKNGHHAQPAAQRQRARVPHEYL